MYKAEEEQSNANTIFTENSKKKNRSLWTELLIVKWSSEKNIMKLIQVAQDRF